MLQAKLLRPSPAFTLVKSLTKDTFNCSAQVIRLWAIAWQPYIYFLILRQKYHLAGTLPPQDFTSLSWER